MLTMASLRPRGHALRSAKADTLRAGKRVNLPSGGFLIPSETNDPDLGFPELRFQSPLSSMSLAQTVGVIFLEVAGLQI